MLISNICMIHASYVFEVFFPCLKQHCIIEEICEIKVASFNCKDVKSSVPEILELCNNNDIILSQETWLADFEMSYVSNISHEFYASGVSAMDCNTQIYNGRPFGGLAIMWRKILANNVNMVKYGDAKIMGIGVKIILTTFIPKCISPI